jgi:hypothetical protein
MYRSIINTLGLLKSRPVICKDDTELVGGVKVVALDTGSVPLQVSV